MTARLRTAVAGMLASGLLLAGTAGGSAAQARPVSTPTLHQVLTAYRQYVDTNIAGLIRHTKIFCAAVDAHHRRAAELRYPKARVYYERIEPVAKSWGYLDTQIDGRWENPVTVRSKFIGFHRIEQLLWQDHTTKGGAPLCHGLVSHERALKRLVRHKHFSPIEIASGATALIDEAAVSKITGEEERYSNTDFVVFAANIAAAQEVATLLTPYLTAHNDTDILTPINADHATLIHLIDTYQRTPGYDHTGYVSYATVHAPARRKLSGAANAYAEALASLTSAVGSPG